MNGDEKKLFFPYLLANYPSTARFLDVLDVTTKYADAIEIGIPFSDPVADGPVIREAAASVLARGFQIETIFKVLQRKPHEVPIALMSYANPIVAYGLPEFMKACKQCGVDFLIVPDVPMEESAEWKTEAHRQKIGWISFVSLLTRSERLERIARSAEGFLYLLGVTGITGSSIHSPEAIRQKAREIRRYSRVPLALGFGIRSVKDALAYMDSVDAYIVGSKLIELVSTTSLKGLETFYKEFCQAINAEKATEQRRV
jgi:tryptophan synthase alpha chain